MESASVLGRLGVQASLSFSVLALASVLYFWINSAIGFPLLVLTTFSCFGLGFVLSGKPPRGLAFIMLANCLNCFSRFSRSCLF